MSGQSPLKAKPLRLSGESVDKEIDRWINDATLGPLFGAGCFCMVAFYEWYGYLTHAPRQPKLFSVVAVAAYFICGLALLCHPKESSTVETGQGR